MNYQETQEARKERKAEKKATRRRKRQIKKMMESSEITIDQLVQESRISKLISESITKKVIILILSMLIILPLLSDDFYADDSTASYNILAKYISNFASLNASYLFLQDNKMMKLIDSSADPNFPIINITYNSNPIYINSTINDFLFRSEEVKLVGSTDGSVIVNYSNRVETVLTAELNFIETFFVCLLLSLAAIVFEKDAKDLVLDPLEVMIEIVGAVAKDPIGAKNVENLEKGVKATADKLKAKEEAKAKKKSKAKHKMSADKYEIMVIQSAIIKISALLAIGFGEAGGEIIKENISSHTELDPMMKGKKKKAIFGFCDIRNFPIVNLALQEKTMVFVNEIAEIVHSSVDKFGGAANKNIGDAFLMVWKFYNDEAKKNEAEKILGMDKAKVKDNIIDIDPLSPIVQRTADQALLGFLDVIIRINKDINILAYRSNPEIAAKLQNYRVKMGFGLHMGWAIEGAIGSSFKIDASYLSPNVNMAARLEAATKQYGVNLLLSGALFDLLSDDLKDICRLIDIVTVKGSIEPVRLYTVDLNLNLTPQTDKPKNYSLKEKRKKQIEKKSLLKREAELNGSIARWVLNKYSFIELLTTEKPRTFYMHWREGFDHYIKGDWKEAQIQFSECLKLDESDGPTKTLMGYLRNHGFTAPKKWAGFRELTSK
jgi:class 3 adenylate cyclase